MEDVLGVEEARRALGELVSDVSGTSKAVIITRRTREKAVLLGYEEYKKLQGMAATVSSMKVSESLSRIHAAVKNAGIPSSAVEEAVREVRSR